MKRRSVRYSIDSFETAGTFAIAGVALSSADVVTLRIEENGYVGWAEACGVYYLEETPASIIQNISQVADLIADGADRQTISHVLPAGGARNAIDCALWDLEAKETGISVSARLGIPLSAKPVTFTIGIAEPGEMAQKAAMAVNFPLLKVKLDGSDDVARIAAVRKARPDATIFVDANSSWDHLDVERHIAELGVYGVSLIEQPVSAGRDAILDTVKSAIPLCADESIQDCSSLPEAIGRYQVINIKLDKAGGLTEALALESEALALGFGLMTGCMLGSSLSIAPAYYAASRSRFVDLDSPMLLAHDRSFSVKYENGHLLPPPAELWG